MKTISPRGMTLIDVLVGIFVMLMVFLGIFGAFQLSIRLVFNLKAETGALALIEGQLEYVRSLPYDSVATVGGIPAGAIPQLQQKTLNGTVYTIRTLVKYVDAPQDGTGNADSNGITADYKLVKVEGLWTVRGQSRSLFAVTDIAPHGIETLASGGTLLVNVFNAVAAPVADATVRVQNASLTPAIDVSLDSDAGGVVSLPGAPTAAGYQVSVIKTGYSSSTTYAATSQNPNPNPGNVAVVNHKTTTVSFGIDLLGSLKLSTFSPIGPGTYADTFTNQAGLSATTSATVVAGALLLTGSSGSYPASGSATSIPIAPQYLSSWTSLSWTASTSAQASAKMKLYYWNASTSSYALVPDTALAGNSAGFATSPVSLAALSPTTYNKLEIMAALTSTNTAWTPAILDWSLAYQAGPTPLPNVPFSVHGAKTIGTTSGGAPIYKMSTASSTAANGTYTANPVEWDSYTVTLSGTTYDVSERCPNDVTVAPGANQSIAFTLVPDTTNSLRIIVTGAGSPVSGATVTIVGSGVNSSGTSSSCGQRFLGSLNAANYTVSITAPGFQNYSGTAAVSGAAEFPVTLVSN